MSKRLQVLLDESEFDEIRSIAARNRMTVAEWVRQSLRRSRSQESVADVGGKLASLRRSVEHSFPSGDIEQMLSEIERGASGEAP